MKQLLYVVVVAAFALVALKVLGVLVGVAAALVPAAVTLVGGYALGRVHGAREERRRHKPTAN